MKLISLLSLIIFMLFEGKKTADNLVYKNTISTINIISIALIIVNIVVLVYYEFY